MTAIRLQNVSKYYEMEDSSDLHVLDDISLAVADNEFLVILGPSGCGKSTFLNVVSGLTPTDNGSVTIDTGTEEIEITEVSKDRANPKIRIGFVFQDPTLLDWKTVKENIKFALRGMGIPQDQHEERIEEVLDLVGLLEFADEYPQALSGGMRQRVGLARALSIDPDVLLMDEPFASLDEITARTLRQDLLRIWRQEQKTIIFVTHNISEAVYLGDRVAIFSESPAHIKHMMYIEIDRPRDMNDPKLLEYEEEALEHLEVKALAGADDERDTVALDSTGGA